MRVPRPGVESEVRVFLLDYMLCEAVGECILIPLELLLIHCFPYNLASA